jgi:hypothetical protein
MSQKMMSVVSGNSEKFRGSEFRSNKGTLLREE